MLNEDLWLGMVGKVGDERGQHAVYMCELVRTVNLLPPHEWINGWMNREANEGCSKHVTLKLSTFPMLPLHSCLDTSCAEISQWTEGAHTETRPTLAPPLHSAQKNFSPWFPFCPSGTLSILVWVPYAHRCHTRVAL